MNIHHNPALVERLAAQYVLGSLRGGARRRFESLMLQHASMRFTVAEWQNRIMPLAQFAPATTPPQHVWQGIQKRLGIAPQTAWQIWWRNVNFWRGLGLTSSVLASALLAFVMLSPPSGTSLPAASYIAALENEQAQTVALVTGDSARQALTVKLLRAPSVSAEQVLQLWAVPKKGNPQSLGLLAVKANADGSINLPMPANVTPQSIPLLAISLEPKGGSTNPNGPSGPILFKGAWVQL